MKSSVALSVLATLAACHAPSPRLPENRAQPGVLPATWYAGGAESAGRSDFQAHAYNADFYILRQAAFTNYEKPFLYLLFGTDRAILFDTGAGKADVFDAVNAILQDWLKRNNRTSIPLIVAHTHGHGDHVAGDAQFANRPGITVVAKDSASVHAFFGIRNWPDEIVTYDLGNRMLDIVPIPGHEPASIAIYDRRSHLLLTGDTFYPGRLYVRDGGAFIASIQRLVDFTEARPVAHFLGTHIEQSSTPFKDYAVGTIDQPSEHVLQLTRANLLEMNDALKAMHGTVVRKALPSLTIWPVTR